MVSAGVYLNTLSNGFVYDDEFQILENPWIKDVRYLSKIFLSNVWAFRWGATSNYYRPLLHIIFMIDYYIFGLKPWGFHLVNIVFHAGVSVLVFLIASMLINHPTRREKSPSPPLTTLSGVTGGDKGEGDYSLLLPLVAAILFATHPIHTEVVAWVSGIPELSFTVFYLLSFYFYIKAGGKYGKHLMLSILFFFLSTLCKETALTLPILLLAYDYSFRNNLHQRTGVGQGFSPTLTLDRVIQGLKAGLPYKLIIKYLPYLIVAGIYFIIRTYAIEGFAPFKRHADLTNYEYFINIFPLFVQHLEKLTLPINLNVFYALHPIHSIFEWQGIITVILTLLFVFFAYLFRRINRTAFFSLLWIAVPLLPVFYIPALGENTFAERYLYLPSVGFVIVVSIVLGRIYQVKWLGRYTDIVIISTVIIISGLYSTGTIKKNYIWQDNYTLWMDTVKKPSDNYMAHYMLGITYVKGRRLDEAILEFMATLRLNPKYAEAHYSLGLAYFIQGNFDEASEEYMTALRLKPSYPQAHNNLGNVYYYQGRLDKAMMEYTAALKLNPNYTEAHYNMGNVYMLKGLRDEALKEYKIALKIEPDFSQALKAIEALDSEFRDFRLK